MATRDSVTDHAPSLLRCLAGLCSLVISCVAADPMPTPGHPDRSKILISSTTSSHDGGPVDLIGIIGLASSVPGEGEVLLRSVLSGSITIARVGENGAFAAVLSGAAGDRVTVSYRETTDGPESEPVELDVLVQGDRAPNTPTSDVEASVGGSAPALRASAPSATSPDGRGRVTVTGEGLAAGQRVALGNVRTGEVVEIEVGADGRFSATIAAAAGDTLVVIVRDPASGATSGMASLAVASP